MPLPSAAVALMVTVPAALAVTRPVDETVAMEVLPDDHVTFLFVAFEGLTVADNCFVSPTVSEAVEGVMDMLLTAIVLFFTVTVQEP